MWFRINGHRWFTAGLCFLLVIVLTPGAVEAKKSKKKQQKKDAKQNSNVAAAKGRELTHERPRRGRAVVSGKGALIPDG